jgi:hypothetical protein
MFTPYPLQVNLLNATTGTGDSVLVLNFVYKTVVSKVTGTGTITAVLEVSNDGSFWVTVQTITADTYYESTISFKFIRVRVTTAGGKNIKADLTANK